MLTLIGSLVLTSCSFVQVNEEREANMVIASVSTTVDGQDLTLNVSRNELIGYVNYIINMYNQYGMQYDINSIMSSGLNSLIKQKYQVLEGISYLYELSKTDADRKAAMYMTSTGSKKLSAESVLTVAERYKSIMDTNESFTTSIDGYVESYEDNETTKASSAVKESINSAFSNGYKVEHEDTETKDAMLYIYHKNEDGEFIKGLKSDYYVEDLANGDVYLQVNLIKGTDKEQFYLPVASSSFVVEEGAISDLEKDDPLYTYAKDYNVYFTLKKATVSFDEPDGKDEDGEAKYETHKITADYLLLLPRYRAPEEEVTEEEVDYLEDYRYYTNAQFADANVEENAKELKDNGVIFEHTFTTYENDAVKDAYRQFRESKKNALIGFESSIDDAFNGLGYYYLSSFESAVLEAVQHETGKTATIVTDDEIKTNYQAMVLKQKEEYSVLSIEKQVEKFATSIKEDLSAVYYIPYEALSKTFYDTGDVYAADKTATASDLNYEVGAQIKQNDPIYRAYATIDNGKMTLDFFYVAHILNKFGDNFIDIYKQYSDYKNNEDKHTEIILNIAQDNLKMLVSNPEYLEELEFDGVESVFETDENGVIVEKTFADYLAYIETTLSTATAGEEVDTFKDLMKMYNDDGGAMANDLGYMVAMGDKISLGWTENFTKVAQGIYKYNLDKGVADMEGQYKSNATDSLSYAVVESDGYSGVHLEMISYAPFYNMVIGTDLLSSDVINIGTAQEPVYCLGLNFNLTMVKDGEDKVCHYDAIQDLVNNERESKKYTAWDKNNTTEKSLAASKIDKKAFEKLSKDLGLK